jgi:hypothetical protein
MPLPLIVDTLDSVPETIRANYVAAENGKFRLDLDGYEDPAGLKSALEKERKAARDASRQAQQWASLGKTPEEIQALVEAQRQAEEDKAAKGGEWDKLKAQMHQAHQAELSKREEREATLKRSLERRLVDADATAAIAALKGVPALLLPHVRASVKVIEEDGEFVARVIDQAGNPRVNGKGEFLSISDLVGEMRQSEVFGRAFEATGTTGSGASSSAGTGSGKTISEAAFQALSPKDRAARMREGYRVT